MSTGKMHKLSAPVLCKMPIRFTALKCVKFVQIREAAKVEFLTNSFTDFSL